MANSSLLLVSPSPLPWCTGDDIKKGNGTTFLGKVARLYLKSKDFLDNALKKVEAFFLNVINKVSERSCTQAPLMLSHRYGPIPIIID